MAEKKAGRIIILIAFVLIICMSNGIWFFAKEYLPAENSENREMAALPQLSLGNYSTFSTEYSAYFNDNLPFRNDLIALNSAIDYFGFGKSSNDNVVVGNDHWLFYSRADDGDPIGCYQGRNLFSNRDLTLIARNCMKQRDYLRKEGKDFVIFIAPNKERVYSEHMPARYGLPAEDYAALQVYDFLRTRTDLKVVYPYAQLMDAKDRIEENVWYKTDTHWNTIGGYIGASALLSELGIEMPAIDSDAITIHALDETSGDLADMLNLGRQLRFADTEYSIDGYDLHGMEETESDFWGMISYHASNADPRSIYVIRDSFASQMAEYIGSQFADSYLRHSFSYSYRDLASCDPDIVVYETVERYVGGLASFSLR